MDNKQIANLRKRAELFIEDGEWTSAIEYCNRLLDIDPESQSVYLLLTLAENKSKDLQELVDKRIDIRETKHYKRIVNGTDKDITEKVETTIKEYEEEIKKDKYNKAVALQEKNTDTSLKDAISLFTELSGYLDSDERKEQCEKVLTSIIKARKKKIKIAVGGIVGAVIIFVVMVSVSKIMGYYPCNVRWGDSYDTVLKKANKCSSEVTECEGEHGKQIFTERDVSYMGGDEWWVIFDFETGDNSEQELSRIRVDAYEFDSEPFLRQFGTDYDVLEGYGFVWHKNKEDVYLTFDDEKYGKLMRLEIEMLRKGSNKEWDMN